MTRLLKKLMAVLALVLVACLLSFAHVLSQPVAETPHAGWGHEVLTPAPSPSASWSLIGIANACGLGASSCVRCHNGERAAAAPAGDSTGPWHRDHAKVPYSCVGCHQGNPRVLRQDVAHHRLVADPLAGAPQCSDCHRAAELPALAARYATPPASVPSP